ncbi:type I-E CRISPR-associated protein Cas7/Cse4/CasC [Corynebacterium liangguodongii]|uniref:Type I-E CRISPR-associated protein Cas7/Cse4/CasC n=1 Tax=Corynebacterium liangguodongii TaxID=2079535 RepID=A0A2S0WG52_9CORY|nr:type I-E CRISPR-associated protein Cas7/Cse4/CasC [Corynebacterium liangguodongii]AWB84755.1 type I-E CRISPR-associated protein Cas7/Cse4/CasC [Corynebacterium liangguodongii]PWB99112.1 type I-E CRISPR-associated protein Cas7/Cse4/CasC [Corynebacterium liangguodongii]
MSLVIDVHALQTVPPSLINRDDTGAPKSAIFGDVPRQRVSSQSWKRAIRRYFKESGAAEEIGARSLRNPEKIAKTLQERAGWDEVTAIERVQALFKAAGITTEIAKAKKPKKGEEAPAEVSPYPRTKYLLFLSPQQIDKAVELLIEAGGDKIEKADARGVLNAENSVDVAMFGRMVADDAFFNVDAAVQVAHALSIHAASPEFDYFTAVDDLAEDQETGAGMIGTVQMMSSTLYRYAAVNVEGLEENLGSAEAAREAAVNFIEAFAKSLPTGKLNTFANQTLPELIYVAVRDTRPVSLVNAFEEPIETDAENGRRQAGAAALAREEQEIERTYGFRPRAAFVAALGSLGEPFQEIAQNVTLAQLLDQTRDALSAAQGE